MAKKHKITQPKIVFISRTSEKYSKHFFPSACMRESAEDFPLSSHTLDTHRLRKSRFKRCLECFPSRFSSHYVPEKRTYCSGFAINFSVSSSSSPLFFWLSLSVFLVANRDERAGSQFEFYRAAPEHIRVAKETTKSDENLKSFSQ